MPGDVYAIIGANGAGKSTLMRTIAGLHRPTTGSVLLDGVEVTGQRAERRLAAGIAMVPEGRRLFPTLSVEENLEVGTAYARKGPWTVTTPSRTRTISASSPSIIRATSSRNDEKSPTVSSRSSRTCPAR